MCNLIPGVRMMVLVVSAVHSVLDCRSFWVEKARSRHFLGIPTHFRMGVYIEKRDCCSCWSLLHEVPDLLLLGHVHVSL